MTSTLLKFIPKISLELLIVFLTLLAYILIPVIFVLILLPIYIFRYFVFKTSWIFRPDLHKMLSALSSSFVVNIPYVYDEPKNTFLVYAVLDGHVDITKFRESFLQLIHGKGHDPKGTYLYDELQMYITKYMGFYYWTLDKLFQIENHVKFYKFKTTPSVIELNSETVDYLSGEVLKEPFSRKRSPWEFYIVHSTVQEQSLVLFRLNHSLADGYSLFKLVLKHAQMKIEQAQPNFRKPNSTSKCIQRFIHSVILFPFRAPYEVIWQLFHCYDTNGWHLPESAMARDNCGFISDSLDIQIVKEIKNTQNVSFAGVLLAALAGGIRKSMLQNSQHNEKCQELPNHIQSLTPLPLPCHTDKLRNYMTGCLVKLPIKISDSRQRLKLIEENIVKIRNSTLLQTNHLTHKLVGGLFSFMIEKMWKPMLSTAQMSSFPGPERETTYLGHRMTDTGFMGNVNTGNLGLTMTLFSYNGKIRICLAVDKSILNTRKQVENLKDNIMQEFHVLYQAHTSEDIV